LAMVLGLEKRRLAGMSFLLVGAHDYRQERPRH
jgi:hypothetical protein